MVSNLFYHSASTLQSQSLPAARDECGEISSGVSIRSGGDPSRGGDTSGHCDRRSGGHEYILTPVPQILGAVWEDVVYAQAREGGEVPYGILEVVVSGGHRPRGRKGGCGRDGGGIVGGGGGEGGGAEMGTEAGH